MSNGLPYDSDQARGVCGAITALMHGAANRTSAELAAAVGPFEAFDDNREAMLRVMEMHWEKVDQIQVMPGLSEGRRAKGLGRGARRRPALRVPQRPGDGAGADRTISFMRIAARPGSSRTSPWSSYKQLSGGGTLKIINRTVPLALESLATSRREVASICDYVEKGSARSRAPPACGRSTCRSSTAPFLPPGGTRSIPWRGHVRMMAAARRSSPARSPRRSTCPRTARSRTSPARYAEGWRLGLKALAVYRDGSQGRAAAEHQERVGQGGPGGEKAAGCRPAAGAAARHAHPITHKFSVAAPRGLYHRGAVSRRRPGECVHHDGQGGEHDRRVDGLLRHGRFDESLQYGDFGGLCAE